MDNYNFTKGKWQNSDIRVLSYNEEKKVSEQVCQCFIMTFKHDSIGKRIEDVEGKANALLISKAPEMLEKLSEIVNILDIKCTDGCVNKTWGDFQNGNGEDVGLEIDKFIKDTEQLIKEATEL